VVHTQVIVITTTTVIVVTTEMASITLNVDREILDEINKIRDRHKCGFSQAFRLVWKDHEKKKIVYEDRLVPMDSIKFSCPNCNKPAIANKEQIINALRNAGYVHKICA